MRVGYWRFAAPAAVFAALDEAEPILRRVGGEGERLERVIEKEKMSWEQAMVRPMCVVSKRLINLQGSLAHVVRFNGNEAPGCLQLGCCCKKTNNLRIYNNVMFVLRARRFPMYSPFRPAYRTNARKVTTRNSPAPYQSSPKAGNSPSPKPRPSYKQLERRWLGIMVGLPVTLMSGWMLYKREVLGQDARLALAKERGNEEKIMEEKERGIRDPKTGRKATIF